MSGVGLTEPPKSGRDGFAVAGAGKYLGIGLVYAWRYTFGLLTPPEHLQVPPELLAVRARRAARARTREGVGQGLLAAAALQPWSHGGVDPA